MSKKSVEFHIKNNDYFGTLATVLSLIRQTIEDNRSDEVNIKILINLEKDLLLLQKSFIISKK